MPFTKRTRAIIAGVLLFAAGAATGSLIAQPADDYQGCILEHVQDVHTPAAASMVREACRATTNPFNRFDAPDSGTSAPE